MSDWKPIETAPKDGQHVLLACAVDPPSWVCEGYYEEDRDAWYQANTHWTDTYNGQIYPSHWMPMPAPPNV